MPGVPSQPAPASHPESAVLIAKNSKSLGTWVQGLQERGLRVYVYPSEQVPDGAVLPDVEVAYLGASYPDILEKISLPNLKAIQCMGAGVNFVLKRPDLNRPHRVFRVIEPSRCERMAFWNLWAVLNCQRSCEVYRRRQEEGRWDPSVEVGRFKDNREFSVGVMGLGSLGGPAAELFAKNGYKVSTWTRSRRDTPGIKSYAGREELEAFLGQLDALVVLLALTPETQGIVDAKALAALPKGAYVINASRGKMVVQDDLVAALDSGHLAGAVLDVTDPEPLPEGHPLWRHPLVRIFPHRATCASEDVAESLAVTLDTREKLLSGKPVAPELELNWDLGY